MLSSVDLLLQTSDASSIKNAQTFPCSWLTAKYICLYVYKVPGQFENQAPNQNFC